VTEPREVGARISTPRAIRVLVVDDEPLGRQRVEDLLRNEPDVEIVGAAGTGEAALEAIRRERPNLVFLDVEMPGKTGLDVVRELDPADPPAIVFVTAYDRFALRAFEVAAVDYLVKPFDDERFAQTLDRARRTLALRDMGRLREQLLSVLQSDRAAGTPAGTLGESSATEHAGATLKPAQHLERIPVEMRGKVRVVPVSDVQFITASGAYAELHTADHRYVIRETMQSLEDKLDPSQFFRVHRSAIVRLDLIENFIREPGGDYEVQLKGGARLPVSRSRREALEAKLGL
jgi:two-component system LytT family response regulator